MRSLIFHLRLLLKAPGFAITAVLILGFGIGANTAIFSLINTVLLQPLPYSRPERLVKVLLSYQGASSNALDYPDYLDIKAAQSVFDSIGLEHDDSLDLAGSGETQRLAVGFVSPSLFILTGRAAILGRTFNQQEDIPMARCWASLVNDFGEVISMRIPTLSGKD
jgi:putative ABC transport system permease protein